jgi:hypothetical protein
VIQGYVAQQEIEQEFEKQKYVAVVVQQIQAPAEPVHLAIYLQQFQF